MEPVLFICHRIPFPPNKGDKIATFNILKFLSQRYSVHLATFVDEVEDLQYEGHIEQYCESAKFINICDRSNLSSGISSLLHKEPVSIAHYRSNEMQNHIDSVIENYKIKNVLVYSSGVAQFIKLEKYQNLNRFLNMTDIDSDKWKQYADKKAFPASLIYQREARLLAKYEQECLAEFNTVSLVTEDETSLFKSLSPSHFENKIITVSNGVDTDYFDPIATFDYTDKPKPAENIICFTGAMDYWANVDAVVWFCELVWPILKEKVPDLQFYIVGSKPAEDVKKLEHIDGVHVTGRVVDVRPYIEASKVCVGPLQIARGIQNKMLEAMAMEKPIVMTSLAAEGIVLNEQLNSYITDEPDLFASKVEALILSTELAQVAGRSNRQWVLENYSWSSALENINKAFK